MFFDLLCYREVIKNGGINNVAHTPYEPPMTPPRNPYGPPYGPLSPRTQLHLVHNHEHVSTGHARPPVDPLWTP